jgi:CubicO group peptidase (beta-lactamase class C family)
MSRPLRQAVLFGCIVAVLVAADAAAQSQPFPTDELNAHVESVMARAGIPGLALLVLKDDSAVVRRGYGVRRIGTAEPVDSFTQFQVASLTKSVTATAMALLVDEEKLDWDDPIQKHLPEFQLADEWVSRHFTVRDALAMRSGVFSGDTLVFSERSRPEILEAMRFLEAPGFRTGYAAAPNLMYFLAGEVIRAVSGMSWDDFVQRRIFDLLGMAQTTTRFHEGSTHPLFATPHVLIDEEPVPRDPFDADHVAAAMGTFTCISDWERWVRFHLADGMWDGQRVVGQDALGETYRPQNILSPAYQGFFNPDALLNAYGFGWVVSTYRERRLVEHAGSIAGFGAVIALVPEERLGVVLLSNLEFRASRTSLLALKFHLLDRLLDDG